MVPRPSRDYDAIVARLRLTGDRSARMQAVVDALWEALSTTGVSWVGFYVKSPDTDDLILGPRRDKPACSPIALFGACGRSLLSRKPLVVTNVAKLGAGYVACDPRDKSEVVIPLMDARNDRCWGVLDADSHDENSFTAEDVFGMLKVVLHAGLSVPQTGTQIETV
jgi:putative methionine-R-sulfoxide reductase with GAF domain